MAGRPPKPTNLKLLHGTARPDRANPAEPQPPTGEIKPPTWLKGRGLRAWKDIAPLLESMRVLTTADPHALAMLCDALAEYVDARAVVQKQGATYETVRVVGSEDDTAIISTMVRARPEVAIASDAWRRASLMMQQFGLTPSSRAKVQTAPQEERDPFDEMFGERQSG